MEDLSLPSLSNCHVLTKVISLFWFDLVDQTRNYMYDVWRSDGWSPEMILKVDAPIFSWLNISKYVRRAGDLTVSTLPKHIEKKHVHHHQTGLNIRNLQVCHQQRALVSASCFQPNMVVSRNGGYPQMEVYNGKSMNILWTWMLQ